MTEELSSRARTVLWVSVAITLALYMVPEGYWLAYPMMLLSTLLHELGHGVAAILVGGEFIDFEMWSNGSGLAHWNGVGGGATWAFASAGGLCGPALVGAVFLLVGRHQRLARWCLGAFGLFLALALVLWVRGAVGVAFTACVIAACAVIVIRAEATDAQIALVFLSTQLALSVFSRGDYLFARTANTGGGTIPSDVQNMATAMGGRYWMWGLACGAFSVAVLALAGWLYLRRPRYDRGGAKVARPGGGRAGRKREPGTR